MVKHAVMCKRDEVLTTYSALNRLVEFTLHFRQILHVIDRFYYKSKLGIKNMT